MATLAMQAVRPTRKYPDAERVKLDEEFDGTVRLTRTTAERWVRDFNIDNRRLRESNVNYYADLIATGRFAGDHPQPIVFDEKGNLADGQHRIYAFLKTDCEHLNIHLRCGMRQELREHLDRGLPRSLADVVVFVADQPTLNTRISGIVNTWDRLLGGKYGRKITPDAAHQIFDTHREAITWVARLFMRKQAGVTRMPLAVSLAQFYERDQELAAMFASVLLDKTGEVVGCQPARKLRDYLLLATRGGGGGGTMDVDIYKNQFHA